MIVKACRHHLQAFFGAPSADAIERGLRFSREAKEAWIEGGGRLASTLNYALVRAACQRSKWVIHVEQYPVSLAIYQLSNVEIKLRVGLFLSRFDDPERKSEILRMTAARFDSTCLKDACLEATAKLRRPSSHNCG